MYYVCENSNERSMYFEFVSSCAERCIDLVRSLNKSEDAKEYYILEKQYGSFTVYMDIADCKKITN